MSGVLDRLRGLSGGWDADPAWAHVYSFTVDHPHLGGIGWRLGAGSDLGLLLAAADETRTMPPGTAVLDVPCGSGVALRGLDPGQGVTYVAADIAPQMLARTRRTAEERGVSDQVRTVRADVERLPWEDGSFDRVVSFTGLHCFGDPRAALAEMVRVLRPGGVLTGSAVLTDTGVRFEPLRRVGRAAGLLGPMCSSAELRAWAGQEGVEDLEVTLSGAIGYFRGTRAS